MRKCTGIFSESGQHWVGDGFPVCTLFSHQKAGKAASPFLLLDHAGPHEFEPKTGLPRGVGAHPHKGFETVTIVYDGEVEHRDSTGAGGIIGPGDVQWMTAGNGIIHEEFHSAGFSQKGGPFEMVQLWVNLLARDKSAPASYQHISRDMIPIVQSEAMTVRVIAGVFGGVKGPARTFTSINVWDVKVSSGRKVELSLPPSHNVSVVILRGTILMADVEFSAGTTVMFSAGTGAVDFEACAESTLLLLSGEPILEPVAAYGPFVMNTDTEIRQAINDLNDGTFGRVLAKA